MCKGSPELLAAYHLATQRYLDAERTQRQRDPGRGRVVAYLNLSGMIGGTFLGDALKNVPLHNYVGPVLNDKFKDGTAHDIGQALLQLETMDPATLTRFNQKTWMKGIPSDVTYFNVVGVPPETGYAVFESGLVKTMRKWIRKFHLSDAANDGYIEYPRNEIPAGTAQRQVTLVLPGSHMLWDGMYAGEIMGQPETRKALTTAMFHTLLDVIP